MVLTKSAFGKKTAGFSRLLLLSCALIGAASLGAAPARAGLLNDIWSSDSAPADDGKPQRGLFNRMFGSDDSDAGKQPAAQPQANAPDTTPGSGASKRKPQTQTASPVDAAPPIQPSGEAIKLPGSEEPNALGRAMNSVGLSGAPAPSKIDYSERPKLVVPAQRDLPPPREGAERQPAPPPNASALVNPPPEYLQKMRGADGQITGLKEGDLGKKKGFFGLMGGGD